MNKMTKYNIPMLFILCTWISAQRVVGYYPQWIQNSFPPEQIDFSVITHVIHAFAWPNADGSISYYDNMLDPDIANVVHQNDRKLLLSFGGWGNTGGFAAMASTIDSRENFISNLLDLMFNYGYDGIDLDWEYPATAEETNDLTSLVDELRIAFDSINPDYMITMAVGPGNWSGQHFEYETMNENLDWFSMMGYDFHGSWSNHAGHNAPLYQSPPGDLDGAVHTGINYLLNSRNIPAEKLNLGVPFYGKKFNASAINGSFSGSVTDIWYDQAAGMINSGYNYYWDENARCPYLLNENQTQLVTFDDPASIQEKAEYVKQHGLGGMMIWALGYDHVNGVQELIESISLHYLGLYSEINKTYPDDISIQIFPNPFNSRCRIQLFLSDPVNKLSIYSIDGKLIASLSNKTNSRDNQEFVWDGKDKNQNTIASGIFVVIAQSKEKVYSDKLLYLK
tara:strand:+ start:1079 stop:2431 length:1353 start_codon:yes stop_codon:yes gene_type:complete